MMAQPGDPTKGQVNTQPNAHYTPNLNVAKAFVHYRIGKVPDLKPLIDAVTAAHKEGKT